jgi:hypothetical protein
MTSTWTPENPEIRGSVLAAGFGGAFFGVFVSMAAHSPGAAPRRENQAGGLWGLMLKRR